MWEKVRNLARHISQRSEGILYYYGKNKDLVIVIEARMVLISSPYSEVGEEKP